MSTLIPVSQNSRNEQAMVVAAAVDYLPRIKLCQGQAKEVSKRKVARGGNFALIYSKDKVEDLTDEVELVIVAGRPKAMETGDVIISIFEPDSPEFKRIQATSKVKDSGCFYGPEFLVYLPSHETFATLFLNNPTARREAGSFHQRIGNAAVLHSQFIEPDGSKYSWFGPLCKDLTTPLTGLPDGQIFLDEAAKFNTELSSQVKAADSNEDERDR